MITKEIALTRETAKSKLTWLGKELKNCKNNEETLQKLKEIVNEKVNKKVNNG